MSDPVINKINILLPSTVYTTFYIIFILSKQFSAFVLHTLVLIYCLIKATEVIDKRNKYMESIPRTIRLNYLNYSDEIYTHIP